MRGAAIAMSLVLGVLARAAHADVWQDALDTGARDATRDAYDAAMRQGDEHAIQANARGIGYRETKSQLALAISSYQAAAAARPQEGEPYFRIGRVLYSFYFECQDGVARANWSPLCDQRMFPRARAEELIEASKASQASISSSARARRQRDPVPPRDPPHQAGHASPPRGCGSRLRKDPRAAGRRGCALRARGRQPRRDLHDGRPHRGGDRDLQAGAARRGGRVGLVRLRGRARP